MLLFTELPFTIEFNRGILGSQPSRDVAIEYLSKKFVENGGELPEDEIASLPEEVERATTYFHHDQDGKPFLFDYAVKGFFKEAARAFNGLHGVKALHSKVERYVFVTPREIPLIVPEGGEISYLSRTLRPETMQGPRVAIARSEMLPPGTRAMFTVEYYTDGPITEEIIRDLLTYGMRMGLGQWRSGGYGTFRVIA